MNFVIAPWFHRMLGARYKMTRTTIVPVPDTGIEIEVEDPSFVPMYFGSREEAEIARKIEVAKADSAVFGIYDFINLSNHTVAEYFAHEITNPGISSWDAFRSLTKIERALLRIRYVEQVVCPRRTEAKALATSLA